MKIQQATYSPTPPGKRQIGPPAAPKQRPPAPSKKSAPKPPAASGSAVVVLLLLCCLLFGMNARAQYTTNAPSVRTNIAAAWQTNSPVAFYIADTNLPPTPTLGSTVASTGITNRVTVSWTKSGGWTNGYLEIWMAGAVPGGGTNFNNMSTNTAVLIQSWPLSASITNSTLLITNTAAVGGFYGPGYAVVRYRQGIWASRWSNIATNTISAP